MSDVARSLTLYEINETLAVVTLGRDVAAQDVESLRRLNAPAEEMAMAEQELAAQESALEACVAGLATKADNIRGFLLHLEMVRKEAKEEAVRLKARAESFERQAETLKGAVIRYLEATHGRDDAGKLRRPRLEGSSGYLLVKGNGGKAPVVVKQPELVPDAMCRFKGTIPGPLWATIQAYWPMMTEEPLPKMEREPSVSAIGEALARGEGVPGAFLGARGEHVESK